jgi:hypothetical protein
VFRSLPADVEHGAAAGLSRRGALRHEPRAPREQELLCVDDDAVEHAVEPTTSNDDAASPGRSIGARWPSIVSVTGLDPENFALTEP